MININKYNITLACPKTSNVTYLGELALTSCSSIYEQLDSFIEVLAELLEIISMQLSIHPSFI